MIMEQYILCLKYLDKYLYLNNIYLYHMPYNLPLFSYLLLQLSFLLAVEPKYFKYFIPQICIAPVFILFMYHSRTT